MKKLFIIFFSILLVSCAGNKFVMQIKDKDNRQELIEFKDYLLHQNVMNGFKESKPLTGIKDSVIISFLKKYDVKLMHVDSCDKYSYNHPSSPFKTCGNIVELYFNGTPFVSNTHVMIFDYSEIPLVLDKTVDNQKHKITDRIYVF